MAVWEKAEAIPVIEPEAIAPRFKYGWIRASDLHEVRIPVFNRPNGWIYTTISGDTPRTILKTVIFGYPPVRWFYIRYRWL